MKKKTLVWLIALILLILVGMGGYLLATGAFSTGAPEEELQPVSQAEEEKAKDAEMISEKWKEGQIYYQDKVYEYNKNLDIYLMMGVDKDAPEVKVEDYTQGGQSDAMFLLAADRENKTISVVGIHRNTMTEVRTCDAKGTSTGSAVAQICTQHGFGDGKRVSCNRTVDAVSNLFYGLPIDGYFSVYMGGIGALNHVVGGVHLTVLDDIDRNGVVLQKGQELTLSDDEAYYYLRARDVNEFDSATGRLERQKQYIDAYLQQLKKGITGGTVSAKAVYNAVSEYCVTDLPLATVIETLMGYDYQSDDMYTIPGEVTQEGEFEEFHADDDALYKMILDLFYVEVQE